jgi:MYND finger
MDKKLECGKCQKAENLSRCARCGLVQYCSFVCQTLDWSRHRDHCLGTGRYHGSWVRQEVSSARRAIVLALKEAIRMQAIPFYLRDVVDLIAEFAISFYYVRRLDAGALLGVANFYMLDNIRRSHSQLTEWIGECTFGEKYNNQIKFLLSSTVSRTKCWRVGTNGRVEQLDVSSQIALLREEARVGRTNIMNCPTLRFFGFAEAISAFRDRLVIHRLSACDQYFFSAAMRAVGERWFTKRMKADATRRLRLAMVRVPPKKSTENVAMYNNQKRLLTLIAHDYFETALDSRDVSIICRLSTDPSAAFYTFHVAFNSIPRIIQDLENLANHFFN